MSDNWSQRWDAYTNSRSNLTTAIDALKDLKENLLSGGEDFLLSEDEIMLDFMVMTLQQRRMRWAEDYRPRAEETGDT